MNDMGALSRARRVEVGSAACGLAWPRTVLIRAFSVVVCVFPAVWVASQETPPPERVFFQPVEVAVVNVEVMVSDRKGRPVSGLGLESFRLFDENQPVDISHFYAARGMQLKHAPVADSVEGIDPDRQLHVVLFFDDSNLDPARKIRAVDNLSAAVEKIVGRADVMAVRYDGSFKVWQPFTRDRQALDEALGSLRELHSRSRISTRDGIAREMQQIAADTASEVVDIPDTSILGSLELESRSYRAQVAVGFVHQIQEYSTSARNRTLGTLNALNQVVRAMSGVSGRKAVIVVSDDLEVIPGQELAQRWEEFFPDVAGTNVVSPQVEAQQYDLGSQIEYLVETANTHRVSLFAIGALNDRQLRRLGAESGGSSLGLGFGAQQHFGGGRTLDYITASTGGRVVANSSSLKKELADLLNELDGYYSLAFRTERVGDGSYHRLRVEVDSKKAKLRYRTGYRDRSHEDALADRTVAAAVLGITENPLKVALEIDPMTPQGDDRHEVPVRIRVPLNQLGLRASGSQHIGEVTVFMVVRDEQGGSSQILKHDFPLEIDNESLMTAFGQYADFVMGVVMRNGEHRIAVGVRDQLGNVDATATIGVFVGSDNG